MCGIFGAVSRTLTKDEAKFERALKKQQYRGPDAERIERIQHNCLFGYNRLAIQDLHTRSMQPFEYKGNWLIFNGEIYNWKELRRDMEIQGEKFITQGDTEVLCRGLYLEGIEFLKKLNGIFAFCFFDKKKETFLLARDLMGVKPLFYSEHEGLLFASDIVALLEYITPEIDEITLARHTYLDWFSAHDNERTFLKGIHGLDRGSYRIYDANGKFLTQEKFFELDFSTKITDVHQAEQEFSVLLDEALNIETRSDTDVGIFLSGGIDSTTIIAHAAPYLLKNQDTIPVFTKYYEEKGDNDDFCFASEVMDELHKSKHYSFEHIAINMDPKITEEDIRQAVKARHAPVNDIRQVSNYKLYRTVLKERSLKVILNGQGADEIYYGYYPLDYWLCKYYRNGEFTASEIVRYFGEELNVSKHAIMNQEYIKYGKDEATKYLEKNLKRYEFIPEKEKRITAFFLDSILQALLLHEDKSGMYSSVEVRVPLINPILSKYASLCDWRIHTHSTESGRHLLRHTLKKNLSEKLVMRPKSPTPKRKKYADELLSILSPYQNQIAASSLLQKVYTPKILNNLETLVKNNTEYAFYGNVDDILLEIAGLFFFEEEILKRK